MHERNFRKGYPFLASGQDVNVPEESFQNDHDVIEADSADCELNYTLGPSSVAGRQNFGPTSEDTERAIQLASSNSQGNQSKRQQDNFQPIFYKDKILSGTFSPLRDQADHLRESMAILGDNNTYNGNPHDISVRKLHCYIDNIFRQ